MKHGLGSSRLENFADCVFAVAATLLIISVTVDADGGRFGLAIVVAWPQYAAYAFSFVMIGLWWMNHQTCMSVVDRVDRIFLFANIALLACIAFLPFPTRLVAAHMGDGSLSMAMLMYGLTLTTAATCFAFAWLHAASDDLLIAKNADPHVVSAMWRFVLLGVPITLAATLLAFAHPKLGLALFVALALYFAVGTSLFGRDKEAVEGLERAPR
jgi:uncharacterized membrane protein